MGVRIQLEDDSGDILLEDGSYLLLEIDWISEPGTGAVNWTQEAGLNSKTWNQVTGGGQSWIPETGD